ncbi:MAG: TIGR03013 family PEP-CTERM/XrtA system glycosyltransferase [Acidobacteria bacterium]|nr:TIGR03013 family PEP-CTERM/XrtA system glycosyltransferase [Acidobacteriota bacterium]
MIRQNILLKTLTLVLVEAGIVFSFVTLGLYLRFPNHFNSIFFEQRGFYKIALPMAVCQLTFYLFDLYDVSKPRLRRELLTNLFQAAGSVLVIWSVIFALRPTLLLGYLQETDGNEYVRYGNGIPVVALGLALTLMIVWRLGIHWVMRNPYLGDRILIVGTDKLALEVAHEAMLRRDLGYKIAGYVSEDPKLIGASLTSKSYSLDFGHTTFSREVLGAISDLNRIVEKEKIDRVVVALQDRRGHMPVDQLLKIRLQGQAAIEEGTALYEKLTGKISVEMLRPSWIIFSGGGKRSTFLGIIRRLFNLFTAIIGIVLSLPLAIFAAIAIKLDSPGPIFYVQERVGKNGRIFKIVKFRSMRQDAEKDGAKWAAKSDPRITRVGNFLRKTRIDEIPQFLNILRGEMSFVGPRAERPVFVEQLSEQIPFYSQRHLVEPGLTGWAQVNYGYGASVEDSIQKLQYDLYYIKNVSLLFDIWIMFKTIKVVLFGYGR